MDNDVGRPHHEQVKFARNCPRQHTPWWWHDLGSNMRITSLFQGRHCLIMTWPCNNIWAQPTIYLPVGCWHISLSSSHCLCRDPSVIVRTSVPAFTHLVLSAAAKPVLSADGSDWHNNMLLTHIKKLTDKAAVSGRRPKKKWDSVLCRLVPRMIDETFMDLVLQGNWCSFLRNK
jgi:hypothetical protein